MVAALASASASAIFFAPSVTQNHRNLFCAARRQNPAVDLAPFPLWRALKPCGFLTRTSTTRKDVKGKRARGGVYASLFGVGAPEALVIGVVALLVFGPKGLAEVARNLGKTLRAFQPTIRELQEVSRDFKTSLEREIGLDEVTSSVNRDYRTSSASLNQSQQNAAYPNGSTVPRPYLSEEAPKVSGVQLSVSEFRQSKEPEEQQALPTQATEASPQVAAPNPDATDQPSEE